MVQAPQPVGKARQPPPAAVDLQRFWTGLLTRFHKSRQLRGQPRPPSLVPGAFSSPSSIRWQRVCACVWGRLPGPAALQGPAVDGPGFDGVGLCLSGRCLLCDFPDVPGLGASLLSQAAAGLQGRQEEHELQRGPHPPLLAPLHHLIQSYLFCPLCFHLPALLRDLRGGPLVRHGLLDHPWRNRLLHVQVGGDPLQHGGRDCVHFLLV